MSVVMTNKLSELYMRGAFMVLGYNAVIELNTYLLYPLSILVKPDQEMKIF